VIYYMIWKESRRVLDESRVGELFKDLEIACGDSCCVTISR